MKRVYVAVWSALGWICLLGLKDWKLAAAVFIIALLVEVCVD